jgi:hypothetical protein
MSRTLRRIKIQMCNRHLLLALTFYADQGALLISTRYK